MTAFQPAVFNKHRFYFKKWKTKMYFKTKTQFANVIVFKSCVHKLLWKHSDKKRKVQSKMLMSYLEEF